LQIAAGLFAVRNCSMLASKVTFSKSSVLSCSDCRAFEVSGLYTFNSSVEVLGVLRAVPALASPLQISSFYPVIKDNKLSSMQNITGNSAQCIEVKSLLMFCHCAGEIASISMKAVAPHRVTDTIGIIIIGCPIGSMNIKTCELCRPGTL
jgi:hypothetical protein